MQWVQYKINHFHCAFSKQKKNNTKFTLELIYETKIATSKKESLTSYEVITKKNKQSPLSNYNLSSILIIIKKY